MRLSMWTLYQWMQDRGLEPEARITDGQPKLHGNRLYKGPSWDTVKVEEAGEPGFMTRMSNGQDCLLFPGHTPLEGLDASSQA